jgi:hypothetical protein
MARRLAYAAALLAIALPALAYEVPVLDSDYTRQICSGMWANDKTFINGAQPHNMRAIFVPKHTA